MAESVRDSASIDTTSTDTQKCNLCGVTDNLKVCARCKGVAYCSKEHQSNDWPKHRKVCKGLVTAKTSDTTMGIVTDRVKCLALDCQVADVTSTKVNKAESVSQREIDDNKGQCVLLTKESIDAAGTDISKEREDKQESSHRHGQGGEHISDSGSSEKFILESEETELQEVREQSHNKSSMKPDCTVFDDSKNMYMSILQSRNIALSEYVTKCLNCYGVCVIDNFLGDSKGTDILQEVKTLYEIGELKCGQLVNANSSKGQVRGDVISWVDGSEKGCENISTLISSIDAIMLRCRKALDHYFVKGRSKAMVAAYPGNGTHFLRHVDNPSGDGRCVTCIYYLNKDWNSTTDGGLLRIFPEGQNRVANVEPKFDRLLFFWSDRRNPHEVLPAYRTRFAVTVWYYDQDERRRAVKKFKCGKS